MPEAPGKNITVDAGKADAGFILTQEFLLALGQLSYKVAPSPLFTIGSNEVEKLAFSMTVESWA